MGSELKEYLNDGDDIVYAFLSACDGMTSAKFVTAERKISELLILIASSTILHKIVATAAGSYDFQASFQKARVKTAQVASLVTPLMPGEQIAFAVNLLYAFDTGAVKFREFLEEYYFTGNGIAFAFTAFVRNVITPLRRNIEAAFIQMRSGGRRMNIGYSAQLGPVFTAISELRRYINLEPAITSIERDELMTFAGGIRTEFEAGRFDIAKNMFGTLRSIAITLPLSRSFFEHEAELDAAISEIDGGMFADKRQMNRQ